MVKSETAVNHTFQEKIASSSSQNKSSTSKPQLKNLNNELALSPIETKNSWFSSKEYSTISFHNDNGSNVLQDVHYVHELPQADEERLEKLFNQLDRNNNGKIDVHDLSAALKEFGLSSQYAEVSWLPSSFIEFFSQLTLEFYKSNIVDTAIVCICETVTFTRNQSIE